MTTDEVLSAITAELSAIGAATDLGSVIRDGDRVATVFMIDDRRFCPSFEPAQANMDGSATVATGRAGRADQ